MQPTEANGPTKIMIFIGVGVVLLGLTIFGVIFAKNRADSYANKTSEPVAHQENPPAQPSSNEQSATNNPDVAGAQTTPSPSISSVSVPAAGPENTVGATLVLAGLTFFATKFVQSRRVGL